MKLSTKIFLISCLCSIKLVSTACDFSDTSDSSSSSSGSSGSSAALPFGGNSYSYSCPSPSTTSATITIPNTSSSSCVSVYQNYAYVFSCNLIDDMASAQSSYNACLAADNAACASNPSDPNC